MVGCCGQGPLRQGAMAEQDLMLSNRGESNKTQQWLPAKGCALPALLQEHQELLKSGRENPDIPVEEKARAGLLRGPETPEGPSDLLRESVRSELFHDSIKMLVAFFTMLTWALMMQGQ